MIAGTEPFIIWGALTSIAHRAALQVNAMWVEFRLTLEAHVTE
jgi:hypothetical protein